MFFRKRISSSVIRKPFTVQNHNLDNGYHITTISNDQLKNKNTTNKPTYDVDGGQYEDDQDNIYQNNTEEPEDLTTKQEYVI